MKYIVNSTAYYVVSETKPETPTQYPPDESVWSNLPPDTDENVWSTRATSYSDGTFEYSEVIVNGGDTTPSVAPDTKTYYKVLPVGSEAPAKPTDNPPSGWEEEEPEYDTQEYDEYSIIVYTYDDGTFTVSEPQLEYKPEDDEPAYEEPETFFYYIVVANGADEPSVPTTNPPPSPWLDTEPEYEYASQDLYSISVSVYSDGTFEYDNVQKETAPEEKTLELAAGNGVYYSAIEPSGGEYNDGDVWFCTATEGNNAGGIFIYHANEDGTGSWIAHQIGTVSVKDGSITADKVVVNDVFARLVLSKDIVATGKIKATNLNITGDSTFSGSLNGATGTFSGALKAEQINIQSEVVRESDETVGTSTMLSANALHPSTGYPNPRAVMAAETPRGRNSVAVSSNEAGGNVLLQSYYIVPGDGDVITQLFVRPEGVFIQGDDVITSEDGEQPPNSALLQLSGDLYVSAGYDGGGNARIEKDLTVVGKINGCTICDRNTVGGTFVYGGSVVVESTSTGQDWAAAHPSYVGSIKDNGSWYNCISIRHQNGYGDGNVYGMRFWSPMTNAGSLNWQQQIGASAGWGAVKTLLDTSNFGTKKTMSAAGASGWTDNATDDNLIPSMSMIAYWNGAYSGTSSNLRYCANGEMIGTNNLNRKLPVAAPGTKGCAQFASGGINVGSVSAGGYKDYSHTFSGTFGGTPNVVVCTYESSAGTSASGNVARKAIVTKRSSTGFTVRLYNNSSSTWSPYVEYIAIYKG